jgi:hypothetical protein
MASIGEMIAEYEGAPRKLREAVAGLTRQQLEARPIAGKMSTLEVVCHIADFDPVLSDRMKRIITHDRPTLTGVDESRYLASLCYHDRDVEEELRIIELTRSQMARILRKLPAEAFQRIGLHTERGELTLEKMLAIANYHIPHHLPFIAEKRKALNA